MTNQRRGIFISFDGPDLSGKSTMLEHTYNWLKQRNYDVVKTREPGGTPLGEEIRELILNREQHPRCEMLLFAAARAQHVEEKIRPALQAGKIVLCDRFSLSSYAYQAVARNLGPGVQMLDKFARNNIWPDFIGYFDVEMEEAKRRLQARAEAQGEINRFDTADWDFKQRVAEGFRQAYSGRMFPNVYRIDANMKPIFVQMQITQWLEWDVIPCHTGQNMPKFGYPERPDLTHFVQDWIDKAQENQTVTLGG